MSNEGFKAVIHVDDIHENTSQELISITSDKLKLALLDHLKCVEDSRAWHTPASLLVAIVLVFSTSTFKDSFGVAAGTWLAFFMFLLVGCVVWLIHSLRKLGKSYSVDRLIEIIKKKKSGDS